MKKNIFFIFLSCISLIGCNNNDGITGTESTVQIEWLNYDGSSLKVDDIQIGDVPNYNGETPVKPSNGQYIYTFTGWLPEISSANIDQTYTAQFSESLALAKVEFDLNGGTTNDDYSSKFVESISSDIFIYSLEKDGLNFRGWSYEGEKVVDQFGNMIFIPEITEQMIFTAIFENNICVSISSNNEEIGTVSGGGYYEKNSLVQLTATVEEGYSLEGWYYDGINLSNQITYNLMTWDDDITIEAKFVINQYDLKVQTFQDLYGSVMIKGDDSYQSESSKVVDFNTQMTISAFTKTERSFVGWFDEENNIVSINPIYTFSMPTHDCIWTAKWESDDYSIIIDINYSRACNIIGGGTHKYGDQIHLTFEVNEGYEFDFWYIGGQKVMDDGFDFIMPNKNVTYVIRFKVKTYSISYNLNGGRISGFNPSQYTPEDDVQLITPTKTGYAFSGWRDQYGNVYTDFPNGSAKHLVLDALWEERSYVLTIDYDETKCSLFLNGEPFNGRGVFKYFDAYTLSVSTIEGYKVAGWYEKINNELKQITTTNNYSVSAKYENDINLVLEIGLVSYNITYNPSEYRGDNPTTYTIEDEVILKDPVREGYTFKGWTDSNNNPITKIEKGTIGDIKIRSNWEINIYTIKIYITYSSHHDPEEITMNCEYGTVLNFYDYFYVQNDFYIDGMYNHNYDNIVVKKDSTFRLKLTVYEYEIIYCLCVIDGEHVSYTFDEAIFPTTYTVFDEIVLPDINIPGYKFVRWEKEYYILPQTFPGTLKRQVSNKIEPHTQRMTTKFYAYITPES